ncbi:monooxygenase [Georgenia yuyongxinii]|uniref:Monooxygenase n=1 Tax=Georgenia yuyongxinii TaxID=2589797 RepID=A0A552WWF0_9MICO|nr:monooxygenase [Georgenia yuyongxinii]TRW46623.1 monooxygenase [Georgenia yuyongxinii]
MPTLLQIDFPTEGPWGEQMAAAYAELADLISRTPGLRWKIWTEREEDGISGGIYLFDDESSARAYLAEHTARLSSFGISDIRALVLDVNETLTATSRGPLSA